MVIPVMTVHLDRTMSLMMVLKIQMKAQIILLTVYVMRVMMMMIMIPV